MLSSAPAAASGASSVDGIKQQLLSLFMFRSTTMGGGGGGGSGGSGGDSLFLMVWSMIVLTLVDKFTHMFPVVTKGIWRMIQQRFEQQAQSLKFVSLEKKITSTLTIELEPTQHEPVLGHALLDFLTHLPNAESILFKNNTVILNHKQPILVDLQRDIWMKMKTSVLAEASNDTYILEVFSYHLLVDDLRRYAHEIEREYTLRIQNKLGDKMYYFNMLGGAPFRDAQGGIDYLRQPSYLSFTMKPFTTNRRFINVMGPQSRLIQKRVEFFRDSKSWYDSKGIPYTLGLLLSGAPGGGKTSTIKCVANELQRHIVNITLHAGVTKTQMEHLFFNETMSVVNNGRTENYVLPIHKRLYVFEDIDCQGCDIVMDRTMMAPNVPVVGGGVGGGGGGGGGGILSKDFASAGDPFGPAWAAALLPEKTQPNKPASNPTLETSGESEKLTLSVLLNLLDGILETPGRVIIMTSNFPGKLDRALIRPGRIDLICEFQKCSHEMITEFVSTFYNKTLTKEEQDCVYQCPENVWTPAEVTKYMFEHLDSPMDALKALMNQV